MRKWICALSILASPFIHPGIAHGVTLVYPNGQPLGSGNIWQRWANVAKVPTTSAEVTFTDDPATIRRMCSAADVAYEGCETQWTLSINDGPAQIEGRAFIGIPRNRACERASSFRHCYLGTFYHELGHAFDATMLTDSDRLAFMRLFPRRVRCDWCGSTQDRWGFNPPGDFITNGPYVEWWAEAYRLCARYGNGWRPADGMAGDGVMYGYPEGRVNWPTWAPRHGPRVRAVVARLESKQARVCALIRGAAGHGLTTYSAPGSVTPGLAG